MRKPDFCICENKEQISFAVTAKLISAFVFATRIVQFLYFLNTKFEASGHFLWLYSLVCVGPGRKPRRPVFSQRGSYENNRDSGQPAYLCSLTSSFVNCCLYSRLPVVFIFKILSHCLVLEQADSEE